MPLASDHRPHRWDERREDWFESARARRGRLWLPVAISGLVQVPFAVVQLVRSTVDTPTAVLALVLAIAGPVALIAARRHPGPVVAVVSAAASANLLLDHGGPPYVALAFAIIGALARGARVWAWAAVASAWIVTLVGGTLIGIEWRPFLIALTTFGVLAVLGIGESLRTRRDRFDQTARSIRSRRESELQAERVRIARELHDVLAHSLSQINVQAGVGLHLAETQPARAAEALSNIKETSKAALEDVRAVLGMLRSEDGTESAPLRPEPGIADLDRLVGSMAGTGLAVGLRIDVATDPPAAVQLAVYRIAQEALTNAVRHSGAGAASVDLTQRDDELRLVIADDGRGAVTGGRVDGRGLTGMRERATLLGGSLDIRSTEHGFTVDARLPTGGAR